MANVKISELPVAPAVCQTGIVPIVQDGCTYSATAAQLSPMSTGVGACSIIGNGFTNTAGGDCSFVAGSGNSASGVGSFVAGQGNSASASYSGAFGCGINNNLPCTFMANNFVAADLISCSYCTVCIDASGKFAAYYNAPPLQPVFCTSFGMNSIQTTAGGNQAYGNNSGSLGGTNNTACCNCATVLNGSFNISAGANSFIGNGQSNCVCNSGFSSVTNGFGNYINFANQAFIGTGQCNCISSEKSSIVGGEFNTIQSGGATGSFIGGGCCNTVAGLNSAVLGGCGNTANCAYSFVAGCGLVNNCPNTFMVNDLMIGSFVGFSGCSVAVDASGKLCIGSGGGAASPMVVGSGTCSIVGNCSTNSSVGSYSFTGGGSANSNNGDCSFLGGGNFNNLSGVYSFLGGGYFNNMSSSCAYLGGGTCNTVSSIDYGVVVGGQNNYNCGNKSVLVGGSFNCNQMNDSFIGGGFCNHLDSAYFGQYSVIVGGIGNHNYGSASFSGGGCYNNLCGYYSSILNGQCNNICVSQFANTIVGGAYNAVCQGSYNFIGGGCCVSVGGVNFCACYNAIVNGSKAQANGQFGFIGNTSDCNVFTPCSNIIACGTYGSTILNGQCNSVCGSFMPGMSNCFSTILGGQCNQAYCNYNLVFGACNSIYGDYSSAIGCNIFGFSSCTAYFNNVCVCGTLSKMSGSFKIPHPDPVKAEAGKFLKHSFVESPTAGDNIYRFKVSTTNLSATIELPDYYKFLNENDQVWVSPVGHFGIAYGTVNADQTAVDLVSNADGEFNVLLIGTRKDKIAKDYWNGIETNEVENEEEHLKAVALKAQAVIDQAKRAEEEAAYKLAAEANASEA